MITMTIVISKTGLTKLIWALSLIGLSISSNAQRQTTISVPLFPSEETAVVTFDADKTSAVDVKRWMQLADHAYYASPVAREFYSCKPNESRGYVGRLEREISKSQQVVDDLDPKAYPPELFRVVKYLKRLQSFWLWQAEQELGYTRSGETPGFQWKDIDTKEKCSNTTEKLRDATDTDNGCRMVFFDWLTCTNKVFLDQLGAYPKPDWDAFLHAHDLRVEIISTADD
jgi:hypothetical protein